MQPMGPPVMHRPFVPSAQSESPRQEMNCGWLAQEPATAAPSPSPRSIGQESPTARCLAGILDTLAASADAPPFDVPPELPPVFELPPEDALASELPPELPDAPSGDLPKLVFPPQAASEQTRRPKQAKRMWKHLTAQKPATGATGRARGRPRAPEPDRDRTRHGRPGLAIPSPGPAIWLDSVRPGKAPSSDPVRQRPATPGCGGVRQPCRWM